MKTKIKSFFRRTLPPVLFDFIERLFARYRFLCFKRKHLLNSNIDLKNSAKGKRAFLIATGPSLKLENLKPLAGEDCFTISNFYLHEDLQHVNPKMHFFAPYHAPMILENYADWLSQADKRLPETTEIVLGHSTYEIVQKFGLFPERKVRYIFLDGAFDCNNFDIRYPLMSPQTGPIMVFPVLAYMGYSEIYLLGCDQTVLRDYKKNIQNFYDNASDVRIKATTGECWTDIIDSHMASMNACKQYKFYADFLNANGVRIINLSQDTWLDFFESDRLTRVIKNQEIK